MLGWLSAAIASASRSNRSLNWAADTLIATSRFRRGSLARYTCPMPPAPRGDRISYGPSLSPGWSSIWMTELSLADQKAVSLWITQSGNYYAPNQTGRRAKRSRSRLIGSVLHGTIFHISEPIGYDGGPGFNFGVADYLPAMKRTPCRWEV